MAEAVKSQTTSAPATNQAKFNTPQNKKVIVSKVKEKKEVKKRLSSISKCFKWLNQRTSLK